MRSRSLLALVVGATLAGGALSGAALAPAAAATGCGTGDVARGKPATASSAEGDGLSAAKAFDGDDTGTRWGSAFSGLTAAAADDQWLQVDLGSSQSLCGVDLLWEAAYGSAYKVQVSDDAKTWSTAYSTTTGKGGEEDLSLSATGRYVRMQGVKRSTGYGYSLWTMRVHAASGATATPSPTPTSSSTPTPTPTPTSSGGALPTSDTPDFGSNVKIYGPSTSSTTIQNDLDAAFNAQLKNSAAQFGDQRNVFLFKPGSYPVYANVGFYTTVEGLGLNPDDTVITRNINVDSGWVAGDEKNATQNFWRSAENLAVKPENGTTRWAVSQAAPMRRVHIQGNLTMGPSNQDYGQGYSSGGYISDGKVDGQVSSGSQQQWYTRDSSFGSWAGGNWNMTFSGVTGAPAADKSHTVLATTPVVREKPYLYVDSQGKYRVFVPALSRNASGATWPNTPGTSLPLSSFYVAHPGDSAARINQALAQGLNLFFTPGVYNTDQTIKITKADTVVYGLGFPTIVPQNGVDAMSTAEVSGVKISGLLFDAGSQNSTNLLTIGTAGSHVDHASDPTVVQDTYFRIGGSRAGKATNSLVVNSDDTLVDHIWAWRADHGAGVGWTSNTANSGLIVNGDDVLATGLFVEHYQQYEVLWNGERGRTIFFQNEMPYDAPSVAAWHSPTGDGWAAYKVASGVTTHEAWGVGSYCYFSTNPQIVASRGFEVPQTSGVKLHNAFTVSLGDTGGIAHVVNSTGGPVPNPAGNTTPQYVPEYP